MQRERCSASGTCAGITGEYPEASMAISEGCGRLRRKTTVEGTGASIPSTLAYHASRPGRAAPGVGRAAATARIRSRTETRMVRRMAESPWVTRLRRPSPGPLPLDRGREGGEGMIGGSDGDGLVDRHAPLGEAPVGAAHPQKERC